MDLIEILRIKLIKDKLSIKQFCQKNNLKYGSIRQMTAGIVPVSKKLKKIIEEYCQCSLNKQQ